MRVESKTILNNYFSEEDKILFKSFSDIIKKKYKNKDEHRMIWEYDQKVGGLGGYAAPLNPTNNPFNHLGNYRNVFRSLQYARSDMYYRTRPRHIIQDAALHIETLVKLLVSHNKMFKCIHNKRVLGKNIEELHNKNIIDNELYERLQNLKKIINYAKHDTDSKKEYTFDYEDAIVFYFEVRKVGNELIKILKHPSYNKFFEIDEN